MEEEKQPIPELVVNSIHIKTPSQWEISLSSPEKTIEELILISQSVRQSFEKLNQKDKPTYT